MIKSKSGEKQTVKIDSVEWGKIVVNGQEFKQVLIVGEEVFERNSEKLHQLFGTTHKIGDWEVKELISNKPEVVVIGNGFDGVLEISSKFKVQSSKLGIKLVVLKTPVAVEEYNHQKEQGKKVNTLIHTTC